MRSLRGGLGGKAKEILGEKRHMSKRILVIDDEEAIRKSFLLALEDTGYRVDTASSGDEGIQMEKAGPYDLIYLDLKMPGLNGVETLREIRKRNRKTPIYIVTAFYEEFSRDLAAAGREALDFEVIKKPIGNDQIELVTRGILEGPVGWES